MRHARVTPALLGTVICLAAAVLLQIARDRAFPLETPRTASLLYVRSPEAVKRMVLGFDALAADVYWIRAIQHFGGQRLRPAGEPRSYHLLYPLLDLTTALDPYFNIAYRFGAIFLSEEYPGGPGRPDQAVALLRRGIAVQPDKWQYYHDIGFVHYWTLEDPEGAAAWFQRAADVPGAPNWLKPLAANMLAQGAERSSARYLWRQMLESEEAWLRRSAERALLQLDALDVIDRLQEIVASRPPPAGEPYSWRRLVRAGAIRGIPHDPTGTPYDLDPETGRVSLSQHSPLHPLPPGTRGR